MSQINAVSKKLVTAGGKRADKAIAYHGMVVYYLVSPLIISHTQHAELTYHANEPLAVGQVVLVPVGKREVAAVVLGTADKPAFATKAVIRVLEARPLPTGLLGLHTWMSQYYMTHPATVWHTMLPAGLHKTRRASQKTITHPERDRTTIVLNAGQQQAVEGILAPGRTTTLLHGITGSGKTQVYIEAAKRLQAEGKSTIILVPEIALTSQLVAEVAPHFSRLIITHSTMTEAERHRVWKACLAATEPAVVIGPRSALFSPLHNLGLIVIDECHEPAFKQDKAPRYSALRAAATLARLSGARLVLGSATPAVSDYYIAENTGVPIETLDTPARPDTAQPSVKVVDMTKQLNFSRHRFLSNDLLATLQATLDEGHQSLLFHNRRGTAPMTLCEHCGWSALCPHCFVPLTLHGDRYHLRCHICNYDARVPTSCPECGSAGVIHKGIGTKLIETELRRLFPSANIARFDGDADAATTVERQYQALYDGTIHMIIGTQVVAKGLDLPQLRTVGVVQADSGLALPDYSSSERVFQLVAQVCGRVGRNHHASNIIIQSYHPANPAVAAGITQSYKTFYQHEVAERKRAHFPPFVHMLKLTATYKSEKAAIAACRTMAMTLRDVAEPDVEVLGPAPSFYERLRDTYRWQLVLKSPVRTHLAALIPHVTGPHWQTDLDPSSLL